jgi:N-acetyl-anhydromuramyl-L-alanine amidase AmpD
MFRRALVTVTALLTLALAACSHAPQNDAERLDAAFAAASEQYAVPRPLLEAIGYSETHWWMRPGVASVDQGYGVMHLVDDGEAGPLARASRLTGLSREQLTTDVESNVMGAAAVLRDDADRYFAETPSKNASRLGDWWQVVMRYSGRIDPVAADLFATSVFQVANRGARTTLQDLSVYGFGGHPVEVENEKLFGQMASALVPDYALARGSDALHYTPGPRGVAIDRVVIHTMQGSYSGSISWFRNPNSAASAHYMIRSADGDITQMVKNDDIAWHAGFWDMNLRSIGIEHEGYVDQPSWLTETMYVASANLTRWICDTYGIPKDRTHIIGHNEVPSTNPNCNPQQGGNGCHHDPCVTLDGTQCLWNWQHYMDLVGGSTATTFTIKGKVFGRQGACPEIPNSASPGFSDCVPLKNARVFVPETGLTVISGPTTEFAQDGYFEFQVPAGNYTPSASAPGYLDGATWRGAGGVAVGPSLANPIYASFSLLPNGTNGNIAGIVYAKNPTNPADTSRRLEGAIVSVGTNIVSAGADGTYKLSGVAPGRVSVTVAKDGYKTVTEAVDVIAGQTAKYDAGLSAADAQPPKVTFTYPANNTVVGHTPVKVEGTVDDPTATLTISGAAVPVTNGRFSATVPLTEGTNNLRGEATDPSGNTGTALLVLIYDPSQTGLDGTVRDAMNGKGIEGAVVSAGTSFAKTDETGRYALDLPAGSTSVTVQAAEYSARTLTATIAETGRTTLDITLVPSGAGTLFAITSPADGSIVSSPTIDVGGIVSLPGATSVQVNGVEATIEGGGFRVNVPVVLGDNVLFGRAIGQNGVELTSEVKVIYAATVADDGCGCSGGVDLSLLGLAGLALARRLRKGR